MKTFLPRLIPFCALLLASPARAEVPPFKHGSINIYPAASVATKSSLAADGNLNDWKPGAFVSMMADPSLRDQFSLRLALAYDAKNLYVAARFRDSTPLLNRNDPRIDPFKAWNGDALQLRFVTDAGVTHPVPGAIHNSDKVVHLTAWQFTDAKQPALDVRFGMDFHAPQTLVGAPSGLAFSAFEGGYVLEGRIPWSVMKASSPQPGQKWLATLQPLWSGPEGKMQHFFFDVVRAAGFQFQTPDGWGTAEFVRPQEVAARLAQQAQAESKLFVTQAPEEKGGIAVRYSNPQKGFVSLAITDAQGQIVRTLLTKAEREAGAQTEMWDGKDDNGKPVPPGKYLLKALTHPGIKPRYVTSVMQSGNPPWGNSGKFGWGADHTAPVGASSDAQGNTYLLWPFNEGGDYLIQVDAQGKKKWGARISWGDFNGSAQDVVFDEGRVYTAKDGPGHGDTPGGRVQGGLFVYDAATGRPQTFPNGTGKYLLTEWNKSIATGSAKSANLVALAASPDRLFAALNHENKIVALDKKTFKTVATYAVPKPRGMVYDARSKSLLAVSGSSIVAIDVASGTVRTLIAQGLDSPRKIALDAGGNIFISTRGAQMQVRVYNAAGKYLRSVGKAGGRPAVGKFDVNGMFDPEGISVDARGQLWVAENDETPKRISLWNATSGQHQRDFWGAASYAPMMAPDPQNPDLVYLHNTRFRVNYETGAWTPEATVYRREGGAPIPPGSEQGFGFMGSTFQVSTFGGKTFAYNGAGAVFSAQGDSFTPLLYRGAGFDRMPGMTHTGDNFWNHSYAWDDANNDHQIQPSEVRPTIGLGNNIMQFGGTFFPDATFIKGRRIFRPSGLSPQGVPLYPKPEDAPQILEGGPMARYSNWLDVWPSMQSNWKQFYAIASLPGPRGTLNGGGEDGVFRFDRAGNILWRYPRVAVHFGLKAPLARTGDLFGALRIAGQIQTPNVGEIVSIGCYRGYFGFLNEDGLFIDQIGYDNGRGPAPNFDVFFIENFSGYFFKHPRTGKVYLFCGDVDARILELQGWDKIRRFNAGSLTITPAQYQSAIAGSNAKNNTQAAEVLAVVPGTPRTEADWNKSALAEIALDETKRAQVRLAYDSKYLHARFEVPDTSPWQNAEGDWRFAFKGGDAVDIQLGAPGGEGKRRNQAGDVRVMIAPTVDGKECRVLAMWPLVRAGMAKEPQLYKSPTGEEGFERVALLQAECGIQKRAGGYTLTAAIPWQQLGIEPPAQFAQMQGDVGILLSDAGGTRTVLRRYLFNQDTAIVQDIPNEVRVVSANWGSLLFGGDAGQKVSSAGATGKLRLSWAGVAGNSGASGSKLVRTTLGRGGGGVVVDGGRIWTGGGDRILTLDSDGGLLWETSLPQPQWVLGGATFASDSKYLYFVAGAPRPFRHNDSLLSNPFTMVEPHLCRVEMKPGAAPQVLARPEAFKVTPNSYRSEISLTGARGEVFVGYTRSAEGAGTYAVSQVDGTQLKPLFEAPVKGGRVSVDEEGNFYLGGSRKVGKVNRQGQPVTGFTTWDLPDLGPVPTSYEGSVMLSCGALWDAGHYGFVGRYTRAGGPLPGVVTRWAHLLGWIAQIADAPNGDFYIKSNEALYVARIEEDKLKLVRRFGALPGLNAVMLTANGFIGAGNDRHAGLMWFDFDSTDPNAAPLAGDWPGPLAQGFTRGGFAYAYASKPPWHLREYEPKAHGVVLRRYISQAAGDEPQYDEGKASGKFEGDLIASTQVGKHIFAIDSEKNQLVHATAAKAGALSPVSWPDSGAGEAASTWKQSRLSSLCAVGESTLLVCASGAVAAFGAGADGALQPLWQLKSPGDGAAAFGSRLFVASSGNQVLLCDSERHCVYLLRMGDDIKGTPQLIASFGEAGRAGQDESHLNRPTLVAISGGRVVIYDEGNARVVKLRLQG